MESVTRRGRLLPTTPSGAQRLPASWNRSPVPFGNLMKVEEGAQRLPASWNRSHFRRAETWRAGGKVLNAFRHHGIGHEIHLCTRKHPESAQRLPASWNRSHCQRVYERVLREVLNAFRHHGIGHLSASRLSCLTPCVLNAFRHHGIGHFPLSVRSTSATWCSTPSGIMESVTSWKP